MDRKTLLSGAAFFLCCDVSTAGSDIIHCSNSCSSVRLMPPRDPVALAVDQCRRHADRIAINGICLHLDDNILIPVRGHWLLRLILLFSEGAN